jgi:hypothetical protein
VRHQKKSTSYVVQEIFSYPIVKKNVTHRANCSRGSEEYKQESSARRAARGVTLGTTRSLIVTKDPKDHSCINKNELNGLLYVSISMFSVLGLSVLSCCCYPCCVDVSQDSVSPMPVGHNSMPDSYASVPAVHGHPHSHAHTHAHAQSATSTCGYSNVQLPPMQHIPKPHIPMQIPMQQLHVATVAIGNLSFAV